MLRLLLLLLLLLLLWLWLWLIAGAGRSPADNPLEHSAQWFERRTHAQRGTLCAPGLPITHREEPP
ncbi:hypothetical protein G6052_17370 [Stenotrophomonas maltophilia]|nr:hypothetical protein G6052_17370 [Stenotrophomonas maltophilia]